MSLRRPTRGPIVLQPRDAPPATAADNPWVLWQPVTQPTPYTCTRCGQAQTGGERFLELVGTEPQIFPVLPRNPANLETVTGRVGRQVLCPACRWAKPVDPEPRQRRKTTLD